MTVMASKHVVRAEEEPGRDPLLYPGDIIGRLVHEPVGASVHEAKGKGPRRVARADIITSEGRLLVVTVVDLGHVRDLRHPTGVTPTTWQQRREAAADSERAT